MPYGDVCLCVHMSIAHVHVRLTDRGGLSMCANFSTKLQGLLSQWQGLMVADLPPLCFVPESRVRSR